MTDGKVWAESLSCETDLEEVKRRVGKAAEDAAPYGTWLSNATVEEDGGQMGASACPVCGSQFPGKYVVVSEVVP